MTLLADSSTQWRVVMRMPDGVELDQCLNTESDCEEWAAHWRRDYSYAEVWIESRQVTPWTKETR